MSRPGVCFSVLFCCHSTVFCRSAAIRTIPVFITDGIAALTANARIVVAPVQQTTSGQAAFVYCSSTVVSSGGCKSYHCMRRNRSFHGFLRLRSIGSYNRSSRCKIWLSTYKLNWGLRNLNSRHQSRSWHGRSSRCRKQRRKSKL